MVHKHLQLPTVWILFTIVLTMCATFASATTTTPADTTTPPTRNYRLITKLNQLVANMHNAFSVYGAHLESLIAGQLSLESKQNMTTQVLAGFKSDVKIELKRLGDLIANETRLIRDEYHSTGPILAVKDGAWSAWSPWSVCTSQCGGGLQMRERSCNNHVSGQRGRDCVGDGVAVQTCNTHKCRGIVAFSVSRNTEYTTTDMRRIPMENSIYNYGGHFRFTDNCFHAPVKGVYSFSYSAVSYKEDADLHLYTQKRGYDMVHRARAFDSGCKYSSAAGSIILEMDKDETASLWLWSGEVYGNSGTPGVRGPMTLFSGKLEQEL